MAIRTDRFQQLREQNGWTKRDLARLCNFKELQIYRYESGATDPTTASLKKLAEVFHVSSDYLLGLTDDPMLQIRDYSMTEEERLIVEVHRREGWKGLVKFSVDQLTEKPQE